MPLSARSRWTLRVALAAAILAAAACDLLGPSAGRDIRFSTVGLDFFHACGVELLTGDVYCWGESPGSADPDNVPHPDSLFPFSPRARRVPGISSVVAVSASDNARCALGADGGVFCTGLNTYGTIGVGNNVAHRGFAAIDAEGPWRAVSAGGLHTCALTSSGRAHCWGEHYGGKLGNGINDFNYSPSPSPVLSDIHFAKLSAGAGHTCALTAVGDAWCWGLHHGLLLGVGGPLPDGATFSAIPVRVAGSLVLAEVSVGSGFTCAISSGERLYCWGQNLSGELGLGVLQDAPAPTLAETGERFRSVSAGGYHACALSTEMALYCWGYNADGQLGTGDTEARFAPTKIAPSGRYRSVHAGHRTTCAIRLDFSAECWGYGRFGQLGNGERSSSTRPVRVVGH